MPRKPTTTPSTQLIPVRTESKLVSFLQSQDATRLSSWRRVYEELLDLIWKFLRAGVMEGKLFKDTKYGTPQGGIASPLLANVYLHELDKYMERYTALSTQEKVRRRRQGLANFVYIRYADDFVILCNGSREQAEAIKGEVHTFLRDHLRLNLSLEKTKVTHINDGFDFLGFRVKRKLGRRGMRTHVLIPPQAVQRHLEKLQAATGHHTHQDSVAAKIPAVNRLIRGWCQYYQYSSMASTQFRPVSYQAFWMIAHWLGRKFKLMITDVMRRYCRDNTLVVEGHRLHLHHRFTTRPYAKSFTKPNPYTMQETILREELPQETYWTGYESRPGMADLRRVVLARDGYVCQLCHQPGTASTLQVDHIRPVHHFKRPVDANCLDNLWTLHITCHMEKTELDRQRESRRR